MIPDRIAAPTQLNDALVGEWPHGAARGAPVWHMDEPIERLGRLCDRFDRVCFGWVGEFDPATGDIARDQRDVGCDAYHRKMEEVQGLFGNRWPHVHMFRGGAVGGCYPFTSVDIATLARNGHRYDRALDVLMGDQWRARAAYADLLEARAA